MDVQRRHENTMYQGVRSLIFTGAKIGRLMLQKEQIKFNCLALLFFFLATRFCPKGEQECAEQPGWFHHFPHEQSFRSMSVILRFLTFPAALRRLKEKRQKTGPEDH